MSTHTQSPLRICGWRIAPRAAGRRDTSVGGLVPAAPLPVCVCVCVYIYMYVYAYYIYTILVYIITHDIYLSIYMYM